MTKVAAEPPQLQAPVVQAASRPISDVLADVSGSTTGLTAAEAAARLAADGPNAVRTHEVRALALIAEQLRSPLLLLLALTALVSAFLDEAADALIIGIILIASIGLGFVNEYRAARAAQALHSQLRHQCTVLRDGGQTRVDVTGLVVGDVVSLTIGEVVPADLRLLDVHDLECDESVLTGESAPAGKSAEPVAPGAALADLTSVALMGTIVRSGSAEGVVVATGGRAEFGRIALELGNREPETEFQRGLRAFSLLLVQVAAVLTVGIFAINVALHRPVLDAVLFSLAIAVGISPQLLPAVVSTSLANGSRELGRKKVLVKRLICIEDLGDIEVLFTDKTGTLTDGRIRFMRSLDAHGSPSDEVVLEGLVCNEALVADGKVVSGNSLDTALWGSPAAVPLRAVVDRWKRVDLVPFDHVSRCVSVLADDPQGQRWLIVKGAPETVLAGPAELDPAGQERLQAEFGAGNRVVAVARARVGSEVATVPDVSGIALEPVGLLVFLDPPKQDAAESLRRLDELGIEVKVITGDNAVVAEHVANQLGLGPVRTMLGPDIDALDDAALTAAIPATTIFARVSPEQKARVVRLHRKSGVAVAFLGDGVNDAVALHAADVGISVDSGTEVAQDAADVILLEKSLDVLADGVVEGRRVFANTIKYVLMGTSSNFGNMFSAAGASAFLSFLPMLPSQILLNNLLYDTSQLAIPTDYVDPQQLRRPSHWDIRMIRRFMLFFGPLSSVFDFATFGILIWVLHAAPAEFRSGWFVESLATQTLVIFAIRTRRIPFLRSRPSRPLLLAALTVVAIGFWLPESPLASPLGFAPLPATFLWVILGLVVAYLVLVDVGKAVFYSRLESVARRRPAPRPRRVHRRAARFNVAHRLG